MATLGLNSISSNITSSAPSGILSSVTTGIPSSISSSVPTSTASNIPSSVPSTVPSSDPSNVQGPSTNMSSYISVSNTTEDVLSDIISLQNLEKELFLTLETNSNLSKSEYDKIIQKINSISSMRINIYNTLGDINSFYKKSYVDSNETMKQQIFAIKIVEDKLNEARQKLDDLELQRTNKIRLIEINDYYGDKYNEHTILMKYLIFMLVPIIILSYLFNKGYIHSFIFYFLLICITVVGSIFIVNRLLSIWSRDNMNYQEYLWQFNAKNAPQPSKNGPTDPWGINTGIGTCIGNTCCSEGMEYDVDMDQCVVNPSNA
jgi:hypothetical protein